MSLRKTEKLTVYSIVEGKDLDSKQYDALLKESFELTHEIRENMMFCVAYQDTEMVGATLIELGDDTYIWNFCVKSSVRGQGIGTGILKCIQEKLGAFYAECVPDNPYISFYLNRGCRLVKKNEKYYTFLIGENELGCKETKNAN